MSLKVTILGCGASGGVPMIGCDCEVCRSADPRNKRLRSSIFIEVNGVNILVDSSPDLRQQALAHGITRIDAIIYTHTHADHIHGIDDLRSFNYRQNAQIPIYGDAKALQDLQTRFAYAFQPPRATPAVWMRPSLVPHVVEPFKPFTIGNITILPFEQIHGAGRTLGIRIEDFAYSTDTNELPPESLDALMGTKTWIVDCLRYDFSPTHASLPVTLGWIDQIRPERAYLTHMSHAFDYTRFAAELPANISPAYDGLVITRI
jgi:phosphoribosyl 1,2-cyclic phosphate phosphodiesterase